MVTVLMPVFNEDADKLQLSINSILNQTFSKLELMIVDDGSNADTKKILQSYKDPRIMQFTSRENQGISKALNVGLRLCRGEYILRQDSDNISAPTRLEKFYEAMQREQSDLVFSDFTTVHGLRNHTNLLYLPFKMVFFNHIEHNVLIKKQTIIDLGLYPQELNRYQDYLLWLKLILNKKKISFVNENLYYYGSNKVTIKQPELVTDAAYDYACCLLSRIFNKSTFVGIRDAIRNKESMNRVQHMIYKDMVTEFSKTLPEHLQENFIREYYHENSSCLRS